MSNPHDRIYNRLPDHVIRERTNESSPESAYTRNQDQEHGVNESARAEDGRVMTA